MTAEFGIQNHRKKEFEQYVGRWIVICPTGTSKTFGGYCVKVEDGYAFLNPFQGADIDPEKGLIRKMVEDESMVPLVGSAVEPQTEENIRNSCIYTNNEMEKQREKEREED